MAMKSLWKIWSSPPTANVALEQEMLRLRAKAPVPWLWLFGKTGSGKSSVVRYLTGAEEARVGQGFRPETRTSRRFDFPDSQEPLLTFVDTRGLGEAAYDPTQDIEAFSESMQLMVVTVRVNDHALQSVIEPLRRIRKSAPHRPVLLVLTCLHEATGAQDISLGPDPFVENTLSGNADANTLPAALQTLIDEKSRQFGGLVDIVIPVDLTQADDGFADPDFGGQRLKQAILEHLPQAYRQALLTLNTQARSQSPRQARARWQVLASSALAGSVGAVPIPWVDIPAVLAIQAHLAVRLASIYEQELTPAHWAVLSSAAGSRIILRMAVREALKFIPIIGMAAGAASSFAFTYALGMSWDWYFADVRGGHVPSEERLRQVFAEQLKRGHELWRAE